MENYAILGQLINANELELLLPTLKSSRSTAGPSQRPRSFGSGGGGGGFVLPPTRRPQTAHALSGFPLLSEDSFARQVENSLEKIRDILNDNKVN